MTLPPGPRKPALLQTADWIRRPLAFMQDCVRDFGDPFTIKLVGQGSLVFLSKPASIQQVFKATPAQLSAGEGNAILGPFVGDKSLLLLDGATHRRHRKLIMPPFHGRRMRAYASIMCEATAGAIEGWTAGTSVSAHEASQALSLEVILRAVWGLEEEDRLNAVREAILKLADAATAQLMFIRALQVDIGFGPWRRFLRAKERIDAMIYEEIARRRASPNPSAEDVFSLLLLAVDEDGEGLTDKELHDELLTLLIAGHETTATGLAWALSWLLQDSESLERLNAEIRTVDDPDALAQLPFLGAVCSEALRLVPVLPIVARTVIHSPFEVDGAAIPVGACVAPCVYLTHRREDLYPEPAQFRPQRFLERKFGPFEYLPFGGGNRRCVGAAFAMYEMKLALATILRTTRLASDSGRPEVERRNVTLVPKGGTKVRVVERC